MAVARTLLTIVYTMLKTRAEVNHELGGSYLEEINKDWLQRYFVKRQQRRRLTARVEPAA